MIFIFEKDYMVGKGEKRGEKAQVCTVNVTVVPKHVNKTSNVVYVFCNKFTLVFSFKAEQNNILEHLAHL